MAKAFAFKLTLRDARGDSRQTEARTLREVAQVLAEHRLRDGNAVSVMCLRKNRAGQVSGSALYDEERVLISRLLPDRMAW